MGLIIGVFFLGRISVNKSSGTNTNNPSPPIDNKNDNEKIKQLKSELTSLKTELNNLQDNTKKNQLENQVSNLENKVKNLTNQEKQDKQTIKDLEKEIKEIKEKMEDKGDDGNNDSNGKQELKVSFSDEGYNPNGELCFMFAFVEATSTEEAKHFTVAKSHPRVKELLKAGKLQLDKKFTIRYKKVDSHRGKIYYFDRFNKDLEIVEV